MPEFANQTNDGWKGKIMTKIAICEDVKNEQLLLKSKLTKTGLLTNPKFDFFYNGKSLLEQYQKGERYDFVFLDVDMPILNGIETGKAISTIDSKVIIVFVTNYPQYAIEAFDCNAFNYLLKNSDDDKFNSVIFKAVDKYKTYHQAYNILTKEGMVTLNVSDIYFVECCQKHLYFHMEKETYVVKKTLSEVYESLSSHGFYQVHQGYIVNFSKVKMIVGNDIYLDNGQKVMISVRKHTEVIRTYAEYIRRYM